MVMAFHAESDSEKNGSWNSHLQELTTTLIEVERTRIQNLMIGGILFDDCVEENVRKEVEEELMILKNETK